MALVNNAPPPLGDPIAQPLRKGYKPGEDPQEGQCSQPWGDWFTNVLGNQEKYSGRIAAVELIGQSAAIAATDINQFPLSAGLYRVLFYLRLDKVDSISASVVLTINFTWDGSLRAVVSGTLGANTLLQAVSNPQPLIRIDANTQVTYTTTVAFGSGDGAYSLDIILEEVQA